MFSPVAKPVQPSKPAQPTMSAFRMRLASLCSVLALFTATATPGVASAQNLATPLALAKTPVVSAPPGDGLRPYAIVTQDQTSLRAAPHDTAAVQVVLWQGDALEVRGQRLDYLKVYDHRRERAGYVRISQVRTLSLTAAEAPELLAVLRFVRDTPGAEALGLAYSAAWRKAAPPGTNTVEAWDATGQMAERLARRASVNQNRNAGTTTPAPADLRLAGQLEGVAAYGVKLVSLERDSGNQICYDAQAWSQVLAQPKHASPEQRARAVLGLTRLDCQDPATPLVQQHSLNLWRVQLLENTLTAGDFAALPPILKNRLYLRRAAVWSTLAFEYSRRPANAPLPAATPGLPNPGAANPGGTSQNAATRNAADVVGVSPPAAQSAAQAAADALAAVDKTELADEDLADYADSAVRVGASRWALLPNGASVALASNPEPGRGPARTNLPRIVVQPGQPGQTCVLLVDAKNDARNPLHQRCTWGVVWSASASASPNGTALALAVQPLAAWRELWVYRQSAQGWTLDVLPAGTGEPTLGYIEFAGWASGPDRLLVARENQTEGRYRRSFEVLRLDTLELDKQASTPGLLAAFKAPDVRWKAMTVSMR